MNRIEQPTSRCRSRISPIIWTSSVASSAVVGSSAIKRSGSAISAMAMQIRWRMPPENSWANWSSRRSPSAMPTLASISAARRRLTARDPPARYWMLTICVPIESTGLSAVIGSWKTTEMRSPRSACIAAGPSCSRSRPSKPMRPAVTSPLAASSRSRAATRVDLPQPDSPTRPTILPRGTSSATSRNACSRPAAVRKSTESPSMASSAWLIAAQPSRRSRGSITSRSVSPKKVKPRVARMSPSPPAIEGHGESWM